MTRELLQNPFSKDRTSKKINDIGPKRNEIGSKNI